VNSIIRFIHAFPEAVPAIRADPTALGTIPADAMRYCEALRTASAFGWYAHPARGVTLLFDGIDIYVEQENGWELLLAEHAADPDDWWNNHCPDNLHDLAPPFITAIGNPGFVQIWSGLLVQTKENWSSLIRPIANTSQTGQYVCFEGIVETDRYGPAPLFINLRLLTTDTPIRIFADEPLFQVQPIHRSCYANETLSEFQLDNCSTMSPDDWAGYRNTVRTVDPSADDHERGQYGVQTRRRAKRDRASL